MRSKDKPFNVGGLVSQARRSWVGGPWRSDRATSGGGYA